MQKLVPTNSFFKFHSHFSSQQIRCLWRVFADAYQAEARELSIAFRVFSLPKFLVHLNLPRYDGNVTEGSSLPIVGSPRMSVASPPVVVTNSNAHVNSRSSQSRVSLGETFAAPVPLESWLPGSSSNEAHDIANRALSSQRNNEAAARSSGDS